MKNFFILCFGFLTIQFFAYGECDRFDNDFYSNWRTTRIQAIVDHYGPEWFQGKKILEVGCGYGHIGAFFAKLGADVTCSDARVENVNGVKERFPYVKTVQADLDEIVWKLGKDWDLIIHFGTLYHLGDHVIPLIQACAATKHMVLETECCDSDNPFFLVLYRDPQMWDQAYNSYGVRPSAANVERVLEFCHMKFERLDDLKLNSGMHVYDWKVNNTDKFTPGYRRFWFIENVDVE
jgi:SAM-dependent methyltransferase